jgi:uncharacterized Zn-binding protein involved in type VI secretion
MGGFAKEGDLSQGIDGPATPLTYKNQAVKTFVQGKRIALVGDQYEPHTKFSTTITHTAAEREIIDGSSKTFFEGKKVARYGDPVADGDKVGGTGFNTFIE